MKVYLEVIQGYLMVVGVGVCHRFEDASVIPFGPQQFAQFLQHGRAVSRHGPVTRQIALSDANKLREKLQSLRVLIEEPGDGNRAGKSEFYKPVPGVSCHTDRVRTSPPWAV